MKWRYLSRNQKIAFGFFIAISTLLLLNALLVTQLMTKNKTVQKQNIDQAIVPIDKLDTSIDFDESVIDITNLQSIKPKNIESTSSNTKKISNALNKPTNILTAIEDSILSVDDTSGFTDTDIELSNLTK
jgi:hypothetical protein